MSDQTDYTVLKVLARSADRLQKMMVWFSKITESQVTLKGRVDSLSGDVKTLFTKNSEAVRRADAAHAAIAKLPDPKKAVAGDLAAMSLSIAGVRSEVLGVSERLGQVQAQSMQEEIHKLRLGFRLLHEAFKEVPREAPAATPTVDLSVAGPWLTLTINGKKHQVRLPAQAQQRIIPGGISEARILELIEANVSDSGESQHTHAVATVTASGNTTVLTPTSGKRLKIYWVTAIGDPDEADTPLVKLGFGPSTTITTEKFRAYAIAKRQLMIGAVDERFIANLSGTGSVAVTVVYDEV